MTSFTYRYRDIRRQRLSDAIAALTHAPNPDLSILLKAEQDVMARDEWRVSDRAFLAYGEDWLWVTTQDLGPSVHADPVLIALSANAAITDAQIAALQALPRAPGFAPPDFIQRVRDALAN